MSTIRFIKTITLSALSSLLLSIPAAADDMLAWHIVVDTSPLTALGSGFIDLQLNPGANDALLVQAFTSNFQSDGIPGAATATGNASGAFGGASPPALDNQSPFNDLFQEMVWGRSFSFDVCFSGPAIGKSAITGSTFSLSLYGPDALTPQLTTNPDGSLLHFDLNPDGTVTPSVFMDDQGIERAVIRMTTCPDASCAWLLPLTLLALEAVRRFTPKPAGNFSRFCSSHF